MNEPKPIELKIQNADKVIKIKIEWRWVVDQTPTLEKIESPPNRTYVADEVPMDLRERDSLR